jgi:hypothetical protein
MGKAKVIGLLAIRNQVSGSSAVGTEGQTAKREMLKPANY